MTNHLLKLAAGIPMALAMAATLTPGAVAQDILSNTGNTANGYTFVSYQLDPIVEELDQQFLAQGFTTGSHPTALTSITMDFATAFGSGFQLALYSNNGGAVGSQIAMLNGTSSPATGLQTYTATSPISLAAGTTYWWVATTTLGGIFGLANDGGSGYTTTDGWSVNHEAYNSGLLWNLSGDDLLFSVDANVIPVPEPSILALTAMGLGVGAILLRRQTR